MALTRRVFESDKTYPRFFAHVFREFVGVALSEINIFDPTVDEHLCADEAGLSRAVDVGFGNADAVHGSLNDDILLGVEAAADFVSLARWHIELFAQAAHFEAVGEVGRGTVVPSGKDTLVPHRNSPDFAPGAGGTFSNHVGYAHEVIGPGESVFHKRIPLRLAGRGVEFQMRLAPAVPEGKKNGREALFSSRPVCDRVVYQAYRGN